MTRTFMQPAIRPIGIMLSSINTHSAGLATAKPV
jgi:hypothetical protein